MGGASVAVGWAVLLAVSSVMTGGGGGVLVAATAVLITGLPSVGSGGTAVASGSLAWQAAKNSKVKLTKRIKNLRIDIS